MCTGSQCRMAAQTLSRVWVGGWERCRSSLLHTVSSFLWLIYSGGKVFLGPCMMRKHHLRAALPQVGRKSKDIQQAPCNELSAADRITAHELNTFSFCQMATNYLESSIKTTGSPEDLRVNRATLGLLRVGRDLTSFWASRPQEEWRRSCCP